MIIILDDETIPATPVPSSPYESTLWWCRAAATSAFFRFAIEVLLTCLLDGDVLEFTFLPEPAFIGVRSLEEFIPGVS